MFKSNDKKEKQKKEVEKDLNYGNFNHDKYATTRPRNDFWGQIKRTVKGQPVDEMQIKMIVNAVRSGLDLSHRDKLIDLCCGNGALSSRFFNHLNELAGVDNSEYLISVAKEFFENPPRFTFKCAEIIEFMDNINEAKASEFNKFLCYGSFSYLEKRIIEKIFAAMESRYRNVTHFYIVNLPDHSKVDKFFSKEILEAVDIDSNKSAIGKWWKQRDVINLASRYGWNVKIVKMPKEFYGSKYRFDAILTRDILK